MTITSHRSGAAITVVTGADGTFSAPLDPGSYTISVSKSGYGRLVDSRFCVVAGKPARFDAALGPDRGSTPPAPPSASDKTVVDAPVTTASVETMTLAEIQEAIAFGRSTTKLKAYQLTESRGLVRKDTGGLLTPFLRVATMTQVAAATGKQFPEREIPAPFVQKLVWIVGDPEEIYYRDIDSPQYLNAVRDVVIRPRGTAGVVDDIKPVWTMPLMTDCDVDALATVLGRQFVRPGIVAAFPLDAIKAGNTVVFTYSTSAFPRDDFRGIKVKEKVRRVPIKESDVRNWR